MAWNYLLFSPASHLIHVLRAEEQGSGRHGIWNVFVCLFKQETGLLNSYFVPFVSPVDEISKKIAGCDGSGD